MADAASATVKMKEEAKKANGYGKTPILGFAKT